TADYDAVLNVWKQTDMGGAHRGDDLQVIHNTLKVGGELFVLIDNESNRLIGTSWITNDSRRLYLHHFGILPEYQGKGLSNLLMDESMNYARDLKLQIKLEVHKNNEIARELYQKYGFKYLGDYEVFIVREI
ncbi:MAG TPA: GNAT family N-acetyltransferase, partial [Bacteroidales bacterium]|nr:GNAT family N-acetyltransferase [Bacteroidales bacterium]